jgi:hypothetical protein
MVHKDELTELLKLEGQPDSPILTLYIDTDQSNASNLNRGYEVALKNMLNEREAQLDEPAKKMFRDDVRKTMEFLQSYTPEKKALIIFCDASQGYFWHRSVRIPIENKCYWERRPYLRTLIEAHDEYQRYGVILTDRAHARLFIVSLGEIEEQKEAFAEGDVKQFDSSGSDKLLSQAPFQRSADEHAKLHQKNVAAIMERLAEEQRFDRLILAGPREAVATLNDLLSARLQKRVIGILSLSMLAKDQEILEATKAFAARREREDESQIVQRLITAAAKHQQAVVGLPPTVEAAVEGRIMSLVYSDDFSKNGRDWLEGKSKLERLQGADDRHPDISIQSSNDLLEWLVRHVTRQGGTIEQVRDGAAEVLKRNAHGIGAFLRF